MKEPITFEFNESPSLRKGKSVTYIIQMNAVCPIVFLVSSKHFTLLSFFFSSCCFFICNYIQIFFPSLSAFFFFFLTQFHSQSYPSIPDLFLYSLK